MGMAQHQRQHPADDVQVCGLCSITDRALLRRQQDRRLLEQGFVLRLQFACLTPAMVQRSLQSQPFQ